MKTNGSHPQPIVSVQGLSKIYHQPSNDYAVLKHIELDIQAGDFVVLLGVSGSGKSTLLNLISGIDAADSGQIVIDGTDITRLNEHERTLFRRDHIGIVFQFFNLIATLTVLENITLPLDLRGENHHDSRTRALHLLERVGLADRTADFPDKLSGGEQQRIAIARALVHEPALVLADEPTGNLDEDTGKRVLQLLLELTRESGKTLLMATHNPEIIPLADHVFRIQDGKLLTAIHAPETL